MSPVSPKGLRVMAKITATQQTRSWLGEKGYTIGTVERFVRPGDFHGSGHRVDLFGCIDLIAIRPGEVLAVQSTGTDWSGHWKKIMEGSGRPGAIAWLETGSPFLLIGWRKLKKGWRPRTHWFLIDDFMIGSPSRRERSREEWESGLI